MINVVEKDLKENFTDLQNKINCGETVIVLSPENKNIIMLSEKEYNEMAKAKRNAEYLDMLDKSDKELNSGKIIVKTMEELEAMEN